MMNKAMNYDGIVNSYVMPRITIQEIAAKMAIRREECKLHKLATFSQDLFETIISMRPGVTGSNQNLANQDSEAQKVLNSGNQLSIESVAGSNGQISYSIPQQDSDHAVPVSEDSNQNSEAEVQDSEPSHQDSEPLTYYVDSVAEVKDSEAEVKVSEKSEAPQSDDSEGNFRHYTRYSEEAQLNGGSFEEVTIEISQRGSQSDQVSEENYPEDSKPRFFHQKDDGSFSIDNTPAVALTNVNVAINISYNVDFSAQTSPKDSEDEKSCSESEDSEVCEGIPHIETDSELPHKASESDSSQSEDSEEYIPLSPGEPFFKSTTCTQFPNGSIQYHHILYNGIEYFTTENQLEFFRNYGNYQAMDAEISDLPQNSEAEEEDSEDNNVAFMGPPIQSQRQAEIQTQIEDAQKSSQILKQCQQDAWMFKPFH
jgi:hypothetical protein